MKWERISPDLVMLCPVKFSSEHLSLSSKSLACLFPAVVHGSPLVYSAFMESLASFPSFQLFWDLPVIPPPIPPIPSPPHCLEELDGSGSAFSFLVKNEQAS